VALPFELPVRDFVLNNQIKTPAAVSHQPDLEYENNLNAADHPFDTSAELPEIPALVMTCTTGRQR
jgi:hypothetical protein